jgi:hypothetical protein
MIKTYSRILIITLLIGFMLFFTSCIANTSTQNSDPTEARLNQIQIFATQTASASIAMETQMVERQKTPIMEKVVDLLIILPDNSWVILSKDDILNLPLTSTEENNQEFNRISLTAIVEWAKIYDFSQISLFGSEGTLTLSQDNTQQFDLILFSSPDTEYYGKYSLYGGEWLGAISIIKLEK